MKAIITAAAMALAFATTSVLAESTVVADGHVENYDACMSMLFTSLDHFQKETGLSYLKGLDSPESEMTVYIFRPNEQMTYFLSCTGAHYKAWVEDFSKP